MCVYPAAFISIVTATIRFTYTPDYPDTAPETCVTNSNLSTVQITELEQLLREQVSNVLECLCTLQGDSVLKCTHRYKAPLHIVADIMNHSSGLVELRQKN